MRRYVASSSAGQRDGKQFAVVDRFDPQGGEGIRRVSFHRTWKQARAAAQKMNRKEEDRER